jgi:two-component system, NtrC family, response regulator GlrR
MAEQARVLLVDDDAGLLRLLSMRLTSAGYAVRAVPSGEAALSTLPQFQPHVVITDLRMDGMDGMALFDAIHGENPVLPIIILTAHGTIPDAVEATRRGVFGFLTKPFDSRDLVDAVERATRLGADGMPSATDDDWRAGIISRSSVMEEVLRQARLVAESGASVLICSESGTGKELLARAIHRASQRRAEPFVPVNCSAIPETLLESELFGHSKGAFTGALRDHKGLFQEAHRGTLFLDEVGDMPLAFQAKLLRALQEGEVRPVGAARAVQVDVRIISATHRDLDAALEQGQFRSDLFYRLHVVRMEMPPLRDRREDIPALATHFLQEANRRRERKIQGFSREAMEALMSASWPGNVRELQNVVEQSAALNTTDLIPASLVRRALREGPAAVPPLSEARWRFERDYLQEVLQITEGNVSNAARLAGRNRTEFYKLLRGHHLDPEAFRPDG